VVRIRFPLRRFSQPDPITPGRDGSISEEKSPIPKRGHAAIFYAESFQDAFAPERGIVGGGKGHSIIAYEEAQVGKCREIALSLVFVLAGVAGVERGIGRIPIENLEFALLHDRHADPTILRLRTFSHPDKQVGPILIVKDARVKQAFYFQSGLAGADLGRDEKRIARKAVSDVGHGIAGWTTLPELRAYCSKRGRLDLSAYILIAVLICLPVVAFPTSGVSNGTKTSLKKEDVVHVQDIVGAGG